VPENRKHPRKPLHPPVAFSVGGGPRVEGVCHDISLGGMFIETSQPPAFGAAVTLYVSFADQDQPSEIGGTVRWTKPGGMGVQFGTMGAKDTYSLTKLMASPSED
jgi:hypothetical protein